MKMKIESAHANRQIQVRYHTLASHQRIELPLWHRADALNLLQPLRKGGPLVRLVISLQRWLGIGVADN